MIYNKSNFQIVSLAPGKDRYHISGIHITKDYTEVTNGHYVVRVSTPVNKKEMAKEFSRLGNKKPTELKEGCFIKSGFAKVVGDAIHKNLDAPILGNAVIVESKGDEVEFAVTDLEVTRFLKGRKGDGKYPDIDAIIPKEEGKLVISVNPDYLIKILQQYKKMNINRVRLDLYSDTQPIKITGITPERDQECLSILMPMKTEERG